MRDVDRESVWRDRPSTVVADALPAKVQDLVIGAGISGLSTALLLARAGRRVAVVDAGEVGSGTTGASSAKVSLLQGTRLTSLMQRHPREVVDAYLEANREGQQWLLRFCQTHGVPFQRRRAVTFAEAAKDVPTLEREFAFEQQLGLESTWLPPVEAPFDVHEAIGLADQAQIDPIEVCEVLADQVQKHEGSVCTHRRVVDIDLSADLVRVRLGDGSEIEAAHVVLATGSPILDRGFHFAKLQAQRSYVIALSGADAPDGMFLSVGNPVVSVRDAPERGLVLVGGFRHVTGRGGAALDHLNRLREWATRAFPDATEEFAWSAQDYARYDASPEAAVLAWSGNRIHVATGYGKWGMTNGVAAALTISADTLGDRPAWAEQLAGPANGRALMDLATFNAEVAADLARSLPVRLAGQHPICTHLGGVLCWNDAEETWDCPLHGSRFKASGDVIEGPAIAPLKHPAPHR